MKEVIHRLLLFIVWVVTLFAEVLVYDANTSYYSNGNRVYSDGFVEILSNNLDAFLWPIGIAYFLSLAINWIMTGEVNNWARKPEPPKREFNDDEDYFV